VASLVALATASQGQSPTVRPVNGLALTGVKHSEAGDVEVHYALDSVTRASYVLVVSGDVPTQPIPQIRDMGPSGAQFVSLTIRSPGA